MYNGAHLMQAYFNGNLILGCPTFQVVCVCVGWCVCGVCVCVWGGGVNIKYAFLPVY